MRRFLKGCAFGLALFAVAYAIARGLVSISDAFGPTAAMAAVGVVAVLVAGWLNWKHPQ